MWPAIIAGAASVLSSMRQNGGQQHQNFALSSPSFFDQRYKAPNADPYADLYGEQDPYADLRQRVAQRFLSQQGNSNAFDYGP